MDQRIIELYDEYTHRPLPRRVFFDRLTRLAGGTAAAMALLPVLERGYAEAAVIAPDDTRIDAGRLTFPGGGIDVKAYRARPRGTERLPSVVVIHENRGLTPHIEDVARRLAVDGFLALAPDALSPQGGAPADEDKGREMFGKIDRKQTLDIFVAAVGWLKSQPDSNGKVGAVGFCWGGGMVNQLAVNAPALDAGVVYYGISPNPADVARIKAPLMMHYASLDKRINDTVPGYEAALKATGKSYTIHMYEGAQHAFNNDSSPARYSRAAAGLAWGRTVAFLRRTLAG